MRRIFADTVFLVGKANSNDLHHESALAAEAALGDAQLVTTDVVFTEVAALLRKDPDRRIRAVKLIREMLESREVLVVRVNDDLFERGLARYESRRDSEYSLVDCISMEVMDDLGITEVLTADRDFELEGFSRLMRNPRELRGE